MPAAGELARAAADHGVRQRGMVVGVAVAHVAAVEQHGVIEHPFVVLPEFGLDGAILVHISSRKGDSGAALVDQQNLVLGFLVGASGSLRVFCPAGMMLSRLGCDIPNAT